MKKPGYITLVLAFLTLAACEAMNTMVENVNEDLGLATEDTGDQFVQNQCPSVKAVDELTGLYQYSDYSQPTQDNLISYVNINQLESTCTIHDKSVTIDLRMAFEGQLGPQAKRTANDKPLFAYPFFVAITGPRGKIFAKEVFAASMTFGRNEDRHSYYEKLRQIIPIKKPGDAKRYSVMVGFQLSEEQLAYNRTLAQPSIEQTTQDESAVVISTTSSGETYTQKIVRPELPKKRRNAVVVPYMPDTPTTAAGTEPSSGTMQKKDDMPKLAPPKNIIVPRY